jgi:hypothetical protein
VRCGQPFLAPNDACPWQVSNEITRASVQNPLEYRNIAETAVAIGSRPADLGMEAVAASDFCLRVMG